MPFQNPVVIRLGLLGSSGLQRQEPMERHRVLLKLASDVRSYKALDPGVIIDDYIIIIDNTIIIGFYLGLV